MGKNDFFLEPDDAQTMGDIDYMRKSKKVRRTFPKTLKNPDGFAIEKSVSSEGVNKFSNANNGFQQPSTPTNYQPPTQNFNTAPAIERKPDPQPIVESTSAPKPAPASEPRKPDNSMDMFRNMAKNIRKSR